MTYLDNTNTQIASKEKKNLKDELDEKEKRAY